MENMTFDVWSYSHQLSPFGQKVLKTLVCQSKSEKNYTSIRSNEPSQHDYVDLNGGVSKPENNRNTRYRKNNLGRKKCHLKFTGRELTNTPTPFDLLNQHNRIEEQNILCSEDTLNCVIGVNRDHCNIADDINYIKTKDPDITSIDEVFDFESKQDKNDITWNNMFDTDLLKDEIENKDIFNDINAPFLNENKICTNSDEAITESFKKPIAKMTKRKSSTIICQPSKKESKMAIPSKNVYRKENYTKTVKNWLNDLEQSHLGTKEDKVQTAIEKANKSNENYTKKKQTKKALQKVQSKKESMPVQNVAGCGGIEIEPAKDESKKKVVQAQLANKDGVMKFKKPKNTECDDVAKKETSNASNSVDKETVKDKKNKNKFVAPIKSQIPVKDITYEIIRVDASNISDPIDYIPLTSLENSEVVIVLIYSNGFCQLNCCFTKDTCIPEGLLITVGNDESIYYFTNIDENFRTIFVQILERNTIICYEGKSILIYLSEFNMNFKPHSILDVKIGGTLLDPENPPETFSDVQKLAGFAAEFTIATDSALQKAAWYCALLRGCAAQLRAALLANSLWDVFVNLEMRLLPIIADMESLGVAVDLEKLRAMEQLLVLRLRAVEQQCHRAAGRPFQVNSPAQLRALLFDELGLDAKCNLRIRETLVKGAKSTSEATLRGLMALHPLPKLVLEYRHLHKAHATFLAGVAHHVRAGVVKPTWVQIASATGRIGSNNPNLQAIPKAPFSLIMFPESPDIENPSLDFRSVYVSREGRSLLAADFRHVECRVFAHAARDQTLLAALRSDDLFRVLAAKWLNKPEAEVSSEDRERTKRVVYASLYGCGARTLSDMLHVGYDQALAVLASCSGTFPSLKAFGRGVVARCVREGRLRTLGGRARAFPLITSTDFAARTHAERQAVNFVVQGSAADLCKRAMVATSQRLRDASPPLRARLLLQIHDELLWEVHDDDLPRVAELVRETMEGCGAAYGIARLPVALAHGTSWAAARAAHTNNDTPTDAPYAQVTPTDPPYAQVTPTDYTSPIEKELPPT